MAKINIDTLIEIVSKGGTVRTGVDIYDEDNVLILEKDVPVNTIKPLIYIKNNGFQHLLINSDGEGGVWDKSGKSLIKPKPANDTGKDELQVKDINIKQKLDEIKALKVEAAIRYKQARKTINQVLMDIKHTGGEFDQKQVEKTVTDLIEFVSLKENAFSYLSREIFSYDTYLYNHSINVCTIGTTILKKFNDHFGRMINSHLLNYTQNFNATESGSDSSFTYYLSEDIYHIALGFFLHDVGKVLIPDEVLNKEGALSDKEFELVKTHSYEKGMFILEKNGQDINPFIKNSVKYHHSPLFKYETNCYPLDLPSTEIPTYVKICKLADIYDAMTSKRCYKEAVNPISVVTELFRKYAEKDGILQFILHSFVKSVGIYPPGSIIYMQNGQMVYILDSEGPLVIPITDTNRTPLTRQPDPIKLGTDDADSKGMRIDRREPLISPVKAYNILPDYLKQTFMKE